MKHQIYICYRRNGGDIAARLIYDKLKSKGYAAFLDLADSFDANYSQSLCKVMEECNDFILILSKNALDRCVNRDDWVRQEIMHAIDRRMNIIPVLLPGFVYPHEAASDRVLGVISRIHAVSLQIEYFDAFMHSVERRLTGVPGNEVPPAKKEASPAWDLDPFWVEEEDFPQVYEGDAPYAFISYAHKDTDTVLPLISLLIDAGYRVWYDGGLECGTEWDQVIATHLKKSACVIVFLSKNTCESLNCRKEIAYAANKNISTLVVYLNEDFTLPDGLDMQLILAHAVYRNRYKTNSSFLTALVRSEILFKCKDL